MVKTPKLFALRDGRRTSWLMSVGVSCPSTVDLGCALGVSPEGTFIIQSVLTSSRGLRIDGGLVRNRSHSSDIS